MANKPLNNQISEKCSPCCKCGGEGDNLPLGSETEWQVSAPSKQIFKQNPLKKLFEGGSKCWYWQQH